MISLSLELSRGDELLSSVPELLPSPTISLILLLSPNPMPSSVLGTMAKNQLESGPQDCPGGVELSSYKTAWYLKDASERNGRDAV